MILNYMSKRLSSYVLSIAILIVLLLTVDIQNIYAEYAPGEILVKFKDTSPSRSASINSIHAYVGSLKKKMFKKLKIHHMKLPKDISVEEAVQLYQQDPNVEYAEPNYIVSINTTPNDPDFGHLWGLDNGNDTDIDAPEVWDIATGSPNVIIAVIDSGVSYNHPDLNANMWVNTGETNVSCVDGIDNDGNGYIDDCNGWDFLSEDNDPTDYNGHGTHVAGTIAAVGNNNAGIPGVMWQAKIMPLRFLGILGSGYISDAIEAILYANVKGAHVMNNSWGGGRYSQALKDAIDVSSAVVICAAGNGGSDGIGDNNDASPYYPASYTSSNLIAVAATDNNDNLANFSNYGAASVDLSAPGVSIHSSAAQTNLGTPVTEYSIQNFDAASGALPQLGWNRGGVNSTWAITVGTGDGGTHSLEDSPGGNYSNNNSSWASYGTIITSVKNNLYTFAFKWKGVLENNRDYLDINYSLDGANWSYVDYRTGSNPDYPGFTSFSTYELTTIAEKHNSFYFGFGLSTDNTTTYDGVYLDDVTLTRIPLTITDSYTDKNGTSMAAPHVSGVAGLIKAYHPSLTNIQIKDRILNSVDPVGSLSGKLVTGGRLNALNALFQVVPYAVSTSQIDLSWYDLTNEDGYKIERKIGSSGIFQEIASAGQNVTYYSDNNLSSNTTYFYQIRAFGAVLGADIVSNAKAATTHAISSSGGGGGGGGGCFIATAAYGSPLHPYVKKLSLFRDRHLLTNAAGKAFVNFYYKYSPPLADKLRNYEQWKFITRIMLTPVVMSVAFPYASLGVIITVLMTLIFLLRSSKKQSTTNL